ncbi:hypothetical protein [Mycobacterium sp.]|uniref:hypothetical protein n=1 Tax=Mycobacterium sp. TaxID=1785 RepID=UPI002C2D4D4C|nr:hypothetical protein [Mycobacterium sp.]HME48511.1 hypothetical protein [Mycobacterium sp.]
MNRLNLSSATFAICAAASVALAGTAAATAIGGSSAADAVDQLKSDGYNVQLNLNGARDVPLSECTVTGVHGLPDTAPVGGATRPTQFTTVYVDVDCPSDN